MTEQAEHLSEAELLSLVVGEADRANGEHSSELSSIQEDNLDRYFALPYGDEIEGQSQVVDHVVAETVDWMIPDFLRIFAHGGEAVKMEPLTPDQAAWADQASDYCNHVFYEDNPGLQIVHDFAFDGLVQRLGVVHVSWEEGGFGEQKLFERINTDQLMAFQSDERVEVVGYEECEIPPTQAEIEAQYPDGECYSVSIRELEVGRVVVEPIAPEEFRVSQRAKSLDKATYIGCHTPKTRSELLELHPEKGTEIDELASGDDDLDTGGNSRFLDESSDSAEGEHDATAEFIYCNEYIRADMDGDGYAERINVCRVGNTILDWNEVDDHPFAAWTPVRIPHRLYGLAVVDQVKDLQKVNSVLWRSTLNATYQTVNAGKFVDIDKIEDISELLVRRPGRIVRTKGDPNLAIRDDITPDVSGVAFKGLEFTQQSAERRSGVSRNTQGLNPDSLNQTARGVELLQNASGVRKEAIARQLADGIKDIFKKILRCVVSYQDVERTIELRGEWVPINPSQWGPEMKVAVHVGLGTGSREAQLAMLGGILSNQEKVMAALGPDNPLAGLEQIYNTLKKLTEASGFRSPEPFFMDPKNHQPKPDKKDPAQAAEEQKMQLEIQKAQLKAQTELQIATMKIESEERLAAHRLQVEQRLAQNEIGAEMMQAAQKEGVNIKSSVRLGGEIG